MANRYLIACDSYTAASPIVTIVGGELVSEINDYRTYTNNLGQTVALIETPTGMLPAVVVTVPNTADAPTQPTITAAPAALADQAQSNVHPLSPQYNGSNDALAAEIAAIEA